MAEAAHNPKLDPSPSSNTLAEEAHEDPPPEDLTKAQASKRIDALKAKLGR